MVNPFKARLIKPARLAHPGMLFQGHGLGLYSGYEKKHGYPITDKAEQKRSHAKAQRRKENLRPIRNNPGPNLLSMR